MEKVPSPAPVFVVVALILGFVLTAVADRPVLWSLVGAAAFFFVGVIGTTVVSKPEHAVFAGIISMLGFALLILVAYLG